MERTLLISVLLSDGEGLILWTQMDRESLDGGADIDLGGEELALRFGDSSMGVLSRATKSCHFANHLKRDHLLEVSLLSCALVKHVHPACIRARLRAQLAIVHRFFECDHCFSLSCPV